MADGGAGADARARVRRAVPRLPGDPASRRAALVSAAALCVLVHGVLAATVVPLDAPLRTRLGFLSGVPHVLLGLVLWDRRPDDRLGPLLVLFGVSFSFPSFMTTDVPVLWTLGQFYDVSTALMVYVLLAFPFGRLPDLTSRVLAVAVAVGNTTFDVVTALVIDPRRFGCAECPDNLLLVRHSPGVAGFFVDDVAPVLALLLALVGPVLVLRFLRGSTPVRRALLPVLPVAVALSAVQLVFSLRRASLPFLEDPVFAAAIGYVVDVTLLLLPVGLVVGALRQRRRRQLRAADLVLALGDVPSPSTLQAAVTRALGDPSVAVGVWSPERQAFVASDGTVLDAVDADPYRSSAVLSRGDEPLAVVRYDAALDDDPGLLATVTAAVRLAVENARLHAQVLAQLEEVAASRARILQAADDARRRFERDLHDGAQQRLLAASTTLALLHHDVDDPAVRAGLDGLRAELSEALRELRALARGMYPSVVAEAGLVVALRQLADRCPTPTTLVAPQHVRATPVVAATVYYLVAEALTNVVRSAGARTATVRVDDADGELLVTVADDGRGGAVLQPGGGLAGLADRVAAAGGRLELHSPAGAGTTVLARLPSATATAVPQQRTPVEAGAGAAA